MTARRDSSHVTCVGHYNVCAKPLIYVGLPGFFPRVLPLFVRLVRWQSVSPSPGFSLLAHRGSFRFHAGPGSGANLTRGSAHVSARSFQDGERRHCRRSSSSTTLSPFRVCCHGHIMCAAPLSLDCVRCVRRPCPALPCGNQGARASFFHPPRRALTHPSPALTPAVARSRSWMLASMGANPEVRVRPLSRCVA